MILNSAIDSYDHPLQSNLGTLLSFSKTVYIILMRYYSRKSWHIPDAVYSYHKSASRYFCWK